MLASPAWSHPDILLQIEVLNAALEQQPANAEWLAQRGDLYRRHDDYAAASKDFRAARMVDPHYVLLDFYDGQLALDENRPTTAEFYLERYLLADPQNAKAWRLRGQASVMLGDPAAASRYFREAILVTAAPSPDLYRVLILSLVASGESNWPLAIDAVKAGLGRFGMEVSILGLGSDIALASNETTQAAKYLNDLPRPLRQLPHWERRLATIDCLDTAADDVADHCLMEAKKRLQHQVESFMTDGSSG